MSNKKLINKMKNSKAIIFQNQLEEHWKIITEDLNSINEMYNNQIISEMDVDEINSLLKNEGKHHRINSALLSKNFMEFMDIIEEKVEQLKEDERQSEKDILANSKINNIKSK